jgi:hypothetical protein
MDYENLVDKFKKYHYIIVVGKKAALLGSSNSSKEAIKLAEDFILKKKKFENQVVARLKLEIISNKLIKSDKEAKIKTIGGPIQIKIEFYKISDGNLEKLNDYGKNNKIFLTDKFLKSKSFDEKNSKLVASATFNNILKKDLFVLNIIDDLVKN